MPPSRGANGAYRSRPEILGMSGRRVLFFSFFCCPFNKLPVETAAAAAARLAIWTPVRWQLGQPRGQGDFQNLQTSNRFSELLAQTVAQLCVACATLAR